MSAVRTPSPWNAQKAEGWRNWEIFASDAEETYVAGVNRDNESEAANAAFIVKACNAHDDLVAALREVVESNAADIEEGKRGYSIGSPRHQMWKRARAALAKAGAP